MRKLAIVCLLAVAMLGALAGIPMLGPVLAAPGTLLSDAPVLDRPDAGAASIGWLPAGSAVTIDGPPVGGFYPVVAGDVSGWIPAASLLLDQAAVAGTGIAAATPVAGGGDLAAPATPPEAPEAPAAFADAGPVGPAAVAADAPILAGPGPNFGLIATAPAGSTVEQTGHLIGGYVTVQYAEVTGWTPLDHLGAPPTGADAAG